MAVVVKCPYCKKKIKWLVDEPYPDDCPACGTYVGHDRADDDVVMPNILHFSTRCSDGVYKAIEKASENRVYEAAEMAGCSASEMSSLKITNMKDSMREGDIAAMPIVNDVTRQMDAIRAMNPNASVGFGDGLGFSSTVATGPVPNAGARFQRAVNESHPSMVGRQVGRDESGHLVAPSTDVMSSRPANEIFQPGYRPRV